MVRPMAGGGASASEAGSNKGTSTSPPRRQTRSVTLGVDNRRVFRIAQRPQLLEGIKVGDVVTITFTRARAVSVEKKDDF